MYCGAQVHAGVAVDGWVWCMVSGQCAIVVIVVNITEPATFIIRMTIACMCNDAWISRECKVKIKKVIMQNQSVRLRGAAGALRIALAQFKKVMGHACM